MTVTQGAFVLNATTLLPTLRRPPWLVGFSPALRDPTPQPMQTAAFSPTCTGMHSTQRMFGCEIREDGRTSSFWQFGFDGQDHVSLDLETLSWVSAKPAAVRTKRWWETERCYAEYDKAYLEGLCLISLHRYLELGGQSLTRKGKEQLWPHRGAHTPVLRSGGGQ